MVTFDYKHPRGAEFALDVLSRCPVAHGLGDRGIKSWVKLGLVGPPEANWMFGGLITTGLQHEHCVGCRCWGG